jgi:elongation factor P hydroxylase
MLDCNDLISLFNREFSDYNTVLVGGGCEPLYTPERNGDRARIVFRADYIRSALHEIAHWVIAGEQRRQLDDYGYWYEPDGRSEAQQAAFERVEVLPQAIEKKFCEALALPFRVSVDNLNAEGEVDDSGFATKVEALADTLDQHSMPDRAWQFLEALRQRF